MDEEQDGQDDPLEELPGLNPDPMQVNAEARAARDEAAGFDLNEALHNVAAGEEPEVPDVPIGDMLDDMDFDDDEAEGPIADAAETPTAAVPTRPAHLGVDPKDVRKGQQEREQRRNAAKPPRRPTYNSRGKSSRTSKPDPWAAWRDAQDAAAEADEPEDVPTDDMVQPKAAEKPVNPVADPSAADEASKPQGNDKELNDQVVETLRRYLEQERNWKQSLLRIIELSHSMLVADHKRLEQLEAAFERGRESY